MVSGYKGDLYTNLQVGDVSRRCAQTLCGCAFTGERMQARDACIRARSHDASGLKHPGIGLAWVRLRDRSEPEADRVITLLVIAYISPTCTQRTN